MKGLSGMSDVDLSDALISVIVPVRDDPEGIREVLGYLAKQTIPQERFEIVVGDDGSEPELVPGVETAIGPARVVSGPPKNSYSARNRAAGAARGSIFAFCDSDCSPDPDWLENGLSALRRTDLVAGEVTFSPPSRPTVWSLLTMDMFLDQERNVVSSCAVTANLFVRRSLFEELGGFDESLPSGGDYEFTRRAVSRGASLAHAPAAIVRHPTIDGSTGFLRKVWFTNRWSAFRTARSGLRPELISLLTFIPFFGVSVARRRAARPLVRLCRARLIAAGLNPGWREDLKAIPLLYLVVAYVAGLGRAWGWLQATRSSQQQKLDVSSVATADKSDKRARHRAGRDRVPIKWARKGALPNLIVAGSQKCGTSALHYYLGLHPDIYMSRPKELDFFIEERRWGRGKQWYERQFDAASPVRGESSPDYAAFPRYAGVPERMASMISDARIVYIVRDPLERIAAHWVHDYAKRREKGGLRTTLLHPGASYVARSQYHLQLQRFCAHFDRDQILVLDSRDLLKRRLHTLRRLFEFVDVDPDFYHPGFVHEQVVHRTERKRRSTRFGAQVQKLSKTRGGELIPGLVWRGLDAALSLSRPIGVPDVREALGQDILELLQEDAKKLRQFTGLPLDHWSV